MMKKLTIMIMLVLAVSISAFSQTTITVSSSASLESLLKNLSGSIATLNIEGELSADDVAALSNTDVVAKLNALGVQNLLMNKATVAADARKADFNFAGNTAVETILLPKDLPEVKASWFASCTKLKGAMSYSTDGTSLKVYQKEAGVLGSTLFKVLNDNGFIADLGTSYDSGGRNITGSKITELVLSGKGSMNDVDAGYGQSMRDATLKKLNLSDCEFSEDFKIGYTTLRNTLEELYFPKKPTTIAASAVSGCGALKTVHLPSTITHVGDNAFSGCNSLTDVEFAELDESVTSLTFGANVFYNDPALKHIILPEKTTNIGESMFKLCTSLEAIRIPNTVTVIEKEAFQQASDLTDITIPASVREIRQAVFANSGIKNIYLMATTPCELPTIYSSEAGWGQSSFTDKQLNAGNTTPSDDNFKNILKREIERGFTTIAEGKTIAEQVAMLDNMNVLECTKFLTSDQMEEAYFGLPTDKQPAILHYADNEAMNKFINNNPLYDVENKDDETYLKTYGEKFGSVAAFIGKVQGLTYDEAKIYEAKRVHSTKDLNATYFFEDKYGRHWPDLRHDDYNYRKNYGNPANQIGIYDEIADCASTANPSILGWRQFVLQSAYSPQNEDEVFKKRYDNTWYTMCFPFDLTDEQLEGAFNTSFNICEFSGAAIQKATKQNGKGEDVEVNNLVLLFTEIATTYRMDKYGNVYERTGTKPNYTYTIKERQKNDDGTWQLASTSKYIPGTTKTSMTSSDTDVADIYESVKGYLAFAGHPYMIHPYNVEKNGSATECVIQHVKYKFDYNKLTDDAKAAAREKILKLYEEETVTRPLSDIVGDVSDFFGNNYDDDRNKADRPVHLKDSGKGKYSFQGTFFPKGEEKVIPYGAYFLGTRGGAKYPKFYREISKDDQRTTGLWKQYSAIILPDENAAAWEATNLNQPTTSTNAKGMDMLFGDFDFVDPMDIEEIVDEALARGEKVQQWNVIVNINGQVVRQGTDVQGLPSGIYIVNGKKYFVKN